LKTYETERLELRPLEGGEWELLRDYLLRNREFLREWEPARGESYYARESFVRQLSEGEAARENRTGLTLFLFNRGEGRPIGSASLSNIIYGPFLSCFLGYRLDAGETNRGKVIEIAFGEEGLSRKYLRINGVWEDHIHYVLLNGETG